MPELEFAVGRAVGRVVWVSFMKTSIETLVIGVQALSRFYASACGDAGAPFIKQNRAVQMMHVAIEQCYGFREILAVAYFIGFGEKSEQLLQASFLEKNWQQPGIQSAVESCMRRRSRWPQQPSGG